jgi:hypothetical protein
VLFSFELTPKPPSSIDVTVEVQPKPPEKDRGPDSHFEHGWILAHLDKVLPSLEQRQLGMCAEVSIFKHAKVL